MLVKVINNDMATAMKKLKKKVFGERILFDYMKHQAYEKPSEKKRRRKNEAIRRYQREQDKLTKEKSY